MSTVLSIIFIRSYLQKIKDNLLPSSSGLQDKFFQRFIEKNNNAANSI